MSLSVLIVDDDKLVREKVKAMLLDEGFIVRSTDEWPEITRIVANERVDLILMDIEMPHLSGDRIARVLLKRADSPRIFLHSSRDEAELRDRAREVGAHGYIPKGITAKQYAARIRQGMSAAEATEG